jgi:dTDP-4-amino-4,6-dideoxygalactose transaminase
MIRMNGFTLEPEELRRRELAAVEEVLRSGWYVLGDKVSAFERAWAAAAQTRHAVGVGNGLDAIEIGLRALGIGPGDEVVTTPMTAFATALAIMRAGAQPVFADVDPDTALLDPAAAERCIGPRTKAVLVVHLYGHVARMDRWTALCAERGVALLEDCAQSHLARWRGRAGGAFGRFGAYSFYPTKNLGAIGDAGALATDDDGIADRARRLRNYGQSQRYHHPDAGMNSRLDELQAAILGVRLEWLPRFTARRRAIAAAYRARLRNPRIELLAAPEESDNHVYHLFVVRCARRDELARHLGQKGVESLVHYPVPVHRQPPCLTMRTDPAGLAHAERHGAQCLSIPCHPQLTDADVDAVVAALNEFE